MADPLHLLVVDDDAGVRDVLQRYFSGQGFLVSSAADGTAMRAVLTDRHTDLVLLDLGLPGEDGFDLTRQLRQHWHGALIILTGRGESVDRVVGLELGADDYVTKPFDLRELLARVRSVLRRSQPAAVAAPSDSAAVLRFAGLQLDTRARSLRTENGTLVALTSGEYELLLALAQQPNAVLSRDALMERIHGREAGPFDRAIDVQIGRLRRKVEIDPANPELIKSVRNAGYVLVSRAKSRGAE